MADNVRYRPPLMRDIREMRYDPRLLYFTTNRINSIRGELHIYEKYL
jgi:hypothetical protein